MQHAYYDFITASLDGMTEDREIIVEIKCPVTEYGKKLHDKALEGEIPEMYYIQMQHQFGVTGAFMGFYVSYDPVHYEQEDNPNQFVCIPVFPDHVFIEDLFIRIRTFYEYVRLDIPPTEDLEPLKIGRETGLNGIVQFTGYATAGKDTFGLEYAKLFHANRFAYANALKDAAVKVGLVDERIYTDVKYKIAMRAVLVKFGAGMRAVDPNVWIRGIFNSRSGLYEAAQSTGAHITDCRYMNEYAYGVRSASQLKVPHRLIWIEREGVAAANEEEALTTSLLYNVADRIIYNNIDIKKESVRKRAIQEALIATIGSSSKEIFLSDYIEAAK
jgi:hypothetical protein